MWDSFKLFVKQLLREFHKPVKPGAIYLFVIGEPMADQFRVKVLLPPVVDVDVESRELTVSGAGEADGVFPVAKDATEHEVIVPQDATVTFSLVDLDDATPPNRSTPSERTHTFTDTVAPAQPGELGIEVVEEIQG